MTRSTRYGPPAPPHRAPWPAFTDGNWHQVRNDPDDVQPPPAPLTFGEENERRCNAARMWGNRHGLRLEYRAVRGGRELWIRFVPRSTPRLESWRQYEHRATGVVD